MCLEFYYFIRSICKNVFDSFYKISASTYQVDNSVATIGDIVFSTTVSLRQLNRIHLFQPKGIDFK